MLSNSVFNYEIKYKQPISSKETITSHFKLFYIIKTITNDVRNLGPTCSLGQAHKCGEVKPIKGIPTSSYVGFLSNHGD